MDNILESWLEDCEESEIREIDPEIERMWSYYLFLENDLKHALRYLEPDGQEETYSFEFQRSLVISCLEIENVFKRICELLEPNKKHSEISEYKEILLEHISGICSIDVSARGKRLTPFKEWAEGPLSWWSAYQDVKHNRSQNANKGNYINALNALAALYVLILYAAKLKGYTLHSDESTLIKSDYGNSSVYVAPMIDLPIDK